MGGVSLIIEMSAKVIEDIKYIQLFVFVVPEAVNSTEDQQCW